MKPTLFISDLHLDPGRPDILRQFRRFTENFGTQAEAVYILGDFVEYWIGDDDSAHGLDAVFTQLRELTTRTPVYLMHGNRDFLIGREFAAAYGMRLLQDPAIVELYGRRALLMHGDTLCTDDIKYQAFRRMVRDENWQRDFLRKPLAERRQIVMGLRATSKQATQEKPEEIMDVNVDTVATAMAQQGVDLLIHGHTHRPGVHSLQADGKKAQRIVLGDWYNRGNVLIYRPDGFELRDTDFSEPL
ncbi:MAG TPA: UDP-2,3-diacylglucosamine diphosphatase [Gammaproteobacteria bacterium]|nr:UDP-2,3-diacylglucosamine diphosphatase [Gammaproteobacteria bacterium]